MEQRINKLKKGNLLVIFVVIAAIVLNAVSSSSLSLSLMTLPNTNNVAAFALEIENNSNNSNSTGNTSITIKNGTSITAANETIVNSKLVIFVSNIEKIKGHLEQAIFNKK